jgi:hypothetical protein
MDIQGDQQDSESLRLDRFKRGEQRPVQGRLVTRPQELGALRFLTS